jgi:hypothetical protein
MTARPKVLLFLVGLMLVALSLACGLGGAQSESAGSAPAAVETILATATAKVEALPLVLNGKATVAAPQPALPESRRLTLEYPPKIRVGDSDVIRLTLEVDNLGSVTPTAEVQGNIVNGQTVQIPNLYDTHDIFAEARLDLAGPQVKPADMQSESIVQGQAATFYWSVQPTSSGTFRGTIWFYLRFVDKGSEKESTQTVSAQPVVIEAVNFLGFSGSAARSLGGIGSIIGAILGFPFADDLLKWLFNRLRKSN